MHFTLIFLCTSFPIMNILTGEKLIFQFSTIFDNSYAQAYAKYQIKNQQYFSKNRVFVNNGDTFNGKYIIKYFKKNLNINSNIDTSSLNHPDSVNLKKFNTNNVQNIIDETKDESFLIQNINIISSIGLLTNKQYKEFLDQPSKAKKINYLKNNFNQLAKCFKPHLKPLLQPTIEHTYTSHNDLSCKIIVTLFNEKLNRSQDHLHNCEIIEKNKLSFVPKLMQCGVIIFDVTNQIASELHEAKVVFNYIYKELMKYNDEEIIRLKRKGIVRKFVLISTVMTFLSETDNLPIHYENEEVHSGIRGNHISERLPVIDYSAVFEFEKLILKSNHSRIKDILKTYVIGTGVIYGHEENALRGIFINAWNNPDEMYILKLNRTIPVFHVDELAKLLFIVLKYDNRIMGNFLLAVEQDTHGFNNLIKSVCNVLCNSRLVLKEDNLVKNQYKFNDITWDLICSDLNIDPILDVIIPDYHAAQTSIISNLNEITREFIEANQLNPLKILVSGQPTKIAINVAEHIAQYYQVKLINIPHLVNSYLESLKSQQNKLKIKLNSIYEKRRNTKHTMAQLAGQTIDNVINDNYQNLEILEDDNFTEIKLSEKCLEQDINFKGSTNKLYKKYQNSLLELDEEIKNIKYKIENLNFKYKDYENNTHKNKVQVDKHYLSAIIKESLTSFTCKNHGYVLQLFPLSAEQMEFIFNDDIGFPKFIVLLSNSSNTSKYVVKPFSPAISKENNTYASSYNLEQNSNFINTINETQSKDNYYDTFQNKTEQHNNINHKYKHDEANINCIIDYCTRKNISLLRYNVPIEIINKTCTNDLQWKVFFDTIHSRIGHVHFKHDTLAEIFKHKISVNKMGKTEKLKTVLYKLSMMEKQWDTIINETLKLDQKQDHKKSVQIHNFSSSNVLPKLSEEICPSDNGGNSGEKM